VFCSLQARYHEIYRRLIHTDSNPGVFVTLKRELGVVAGVHLSDSKAAIKHLGFFFISHSSDTTTKNPRRRETVSVDKALEARNLWPRMQQPGRGKPDRNSQRLIPTF
jgi:hypothetical protein